MTKYVYDEKVYDEILDKLIKKGRNLRSKMTKAQKSSDYNQMDKIEKSYNRLIISFENVINMLEVEDFLISGPKGKDPK